MSVESPISVAMNVFIGEDRIFEYVVTDSNGAAVNITGWNLRWTVRVMTSSTTTLLDKTTSDDIRITDGANGICQVTMHAADTYDPVAGAILIAPGAYVYVLQRTDAGFVSELAYGDFVLRLSAGR